MNGHQIVAYWAMMKGYCLTRKAYGGLWVKTALGWEFFPNE